MPDVPAFARQTQPDRKLTMARSASLSLLFVAALMFMGFAYSFTPV